MSDAPIIRFDSVGFAYPQGIVLEGVNFVMPAGKINCLVGPNGGGKSTLLKLILGLLKPKSGRVEVFGKSPRLARDKIGYMPQHVHLDPQFPIAVEEIVQMGRLRGNGFGFLNNEDRTAAEKALDEVGMRSYAKESFTSLSGGMRQRVLIARALAVEPQLLLLDEPTAMVDARIEAHLLAHIKELHKRMTILLVSHDANFVSSLVDRVFCVNRSVVEHSFKYVSDQSILELYGEPVKKVSHDHHHVAGEGCCHE